MTMLTVQDLKIQYVGHLEVWSITNELGDFRVGVSCREDALVNANDADKVYPADVRRDNIVVHRCQHGITRFTATPAWLPYGRDIKISGVGFMRG